jgi:hypothetical protein
MFITDIIATAESSSARSMYCPSPVRSRADNAASIDTAVYMPVKRSVIAIPAFCGPPPGTSSRSPVRLMKPLMPWMMKSYPARIRVGAVLPEPGDGRIDDARLIADTLA